MYALQPQPFRNSLIIDTSESPYWQAREWISHSWEGGMCFRGRFSGLERHDSGLCRGHLSASQSSGRFSFNRTATLRPKSPTACRNCAVANSASTTTGKVPVVGICTECRTVRAKGWNACLAYQKLIKKMTGLSLQAA